MKLTYFVPAGAKRNDDDTLFFSTELVWWLKIGLPNSLTPKVMEVVDKYFPL